MGIYLMSGPVLAASHEPYLIQQRTTRASNDSYFTDKKTEPQEFTCSPRSPNQYSLD